MPAVQETIEQVKLIDVDQYKYGFETNVEMEKAPIGLSEGALRMSLGWNSTKEDVIRFAGACEKVVATLYKRRASAA